MGQGADIRGFYAYACIRDMRPMEATSCIVVDKYILPRKICTSLSSIIGEKSPLLAFPTGETGPPSHKPSRKSFRNNTIYSFTTPFSWPLLKRRLCRARFVNFSSACKGPVNTNVLFELRRALFIKKRTKFINMRS